MNWASVLFSRSDCLTCELPAHTPVQSAPATHPKELQRGILHLGLPPIIDRDYRGDAYRSRFPMDHFTKWAAILTAHRLEQQGRVRNAKHEKTGTGFVSGLKLVSFRVTIWAEIIG